MSATAMRRRASSQAERNAAARLYAPDGAVPASIGTAARQGATPRPANVPIAILRKNQHEEVRIELTTFNGHELISVRIWANPHDGGSERIPTKAGIAAKVTLLPALIAALQKAEATARAQGLLP